MRHGFVRMWMVEYCLKYSTAVGLMKGNPDPAQLKYKLRPTVPGRGGENFDMFHKLVVCKEGSTYRLLYVQRGWCAYAVTKHRH